MPTPDGAAALALQDVGCAFFDPEPSDGRLTLETVQLYSALLEP
jgi:hypothetical protein